jgi:hypothetical protein
MMSWAGNLDSIWFVRACSATDYYYYYYYYYNYMGNMEENFRR